MDYWKECIESAFDDAGIIATDEQIEDVAGSVEGGHDNYGMAHGHDAIPNPRDADIDKLKVRIKEVESERDEVALDFRKNVAMRRNCDVTDVTLEGDGHATIRS